MGQIKKRIAPVYEGTWDSTKSYLQLSVVVYTDENTYIAKKDVPAGILPTNEEYFRLYIDNSKPRKILDDLISKVNVISDDVDNLNTDVSNFKKSAKTIKIYGVRYYFGQSSPTLERLGDAVGMIANATKNGEAVRNDFDTADVFKDIKEVKRDKVTHKLLARKGDADYDTVDGEVMIDFPDAYFKFELSADKTYVDIYVCAYQMSGFTKVDKFSVGKYPLSLDSAGKLQTRSGYCAEGWMSLTNTRTKIANEYGEGACQLDWRYDVITTLYLIEFANFDSQAILGQGHCGYRYNFNADKALVAETNVNRIIVSTSTANNFSIGQQVFLGTGDGSSNIAKYRTITAKENYSANGITGTAIILDGAAFSPTTATSIMSGAQKTGGADKIKASSGCMSNNARSAVSYRGFERNSIYDWVDGRLIKNAVIYECTDPTKYASDVGDGYEALTEYTIPEGTNGYIKTLGFDRNHPFTRIQKEYGGGSNTYITDYGWSNRANGVFGARVGGNANVGATAGLFCWGVNGGPSAAGWYCGARVLMHQI